MNDIINIEDNIQSKIYNVRGIQVMLDEDLAEFYQVETKVFNQAVKRNIKRFPEDFMFQLTQNEYNFLRSQNGTSSLQNNYKNIQIKISKIDFKLLEKVLIEK